MNLFRKLNETYFGKLIRIPLRLIPKDAVVRILLGKSRGKKWIVGSGVHGYWLGTFEYKTRILVEKLIKEKGIFFDIGAHVGFYTLLGSSLVGPGGKVIAFEPLPRNVYYLKKHVKMNHLINVKIIEAAVSDADGWASFYEGRTSGRGHISNQGTLKVKQVCLDDLIFRKGIPVPQDIKIDVESAGSLVLKGAQRLFQKYHPLLFLSTHAWNIHIECCRFLKLTGYTVKLIDGDDLNNKEVAEIIAY
jgi:FkbM family methyltransferase